MGGKVAKMQWEGLAIRTHIHTRIFLKIRAQMTKEILGVPQSLVNLRFNNQCYPTILNCTRILECLEHWRTFVMHLANVKKMSKIETIRKTQYEICVA